MADENVSQNVKNEFEMIQKRLADDKAKAAKNESEKDKIQKDYNAYKNAAIDKLTNQQKAIQKRCEAGKDVEKNLKEFVEELSDKKLKELEFDIKKLKIKLRQKNKEIQDLRSKAKGELATV